MITERIALLEKELAEMKKQAAQMYFQIAVNNKTELNTQYAELKEKITTYQQDLEHANEWLKNNGV